MQKILKQAFPFLVITLIIFAGYYFSKKSHSGSAVTYSTKQEDSALTLVPMFDRPEVRLVNWQKEVIHSWPIQARRARLSKDCHLFVVHKDNTLMEDGKNRNTVDVVSEYNWEGKLVKEHRVPGETHHDVRLLDKNQILMLYYKSTRFNPWSASLPPAFRKYRNYKVKFDAVSIQDLNSGAETFQWDFLHSYEPVACGNFECPLRSRRFFRQKDQFLDWTHVNSVSVIPENKWFEQGYSEFRPGNLLFTVRNWSALIIVDRISKDVVWEYAGDRLGFFEGGHDAYMIEKDYPGAGNILMFDNGDPRLKLDIHTKKSRVIEFDPVSKEAVWFFDNQGKLFSQSMGNAQRLQNGDTLVSEDTTGNIYQVTKDKRLVWQYAAEGHTARAHRFEGLKGLECLESKLDSYFQK